MRDEIRLALCHEVSNLELEFAQLRGIKSAVVSHPKVISASDSRAVLEVRLSGEGWHAIQVEFDLLHSDQPHPDVLRYIVDGQKEAYCLREYPNSHLATWFVPQDMAHVELAPLTDTARLHVLDAHRHAINPA